MSDRTKQSILEDLGVDPVDFSKFDDVELTLRGMVLAHHLYENGAVSFESCFDSTMSAAFLKRYAECFGYLHTITEGMTVIIDVKKFSVKV